LYLLIETDIVVYKEHISEDLMILKLYFPIILLGFIGGITPGPILIMAFSEILIKSRQNIKRAVEIIIVTVFTETIIALFLITFSKVFKIPPILFHLVSIIGISILFMLSINMFKVKEMNTAVEKKDTNLLKVFLIMIFNGPLWMFWISVCLPLVYQMADKMVFGEYIFLIIFEISMIAGISLMFFLFSLITKNVKNQKKIQILYIILGVILGLLALKMLISEIEYFTEIFGIIVNNPI
jgi:threonine/homoserine/homoserine lactone efflux protein